MTMENKVFAKLIIGNGFDLKCGLNTRYYDFFESGDFNKREIEDWVNNTLTKYDQSKDSPARTSADSPSFNVWSLFFLLCSSNIGKGYKKIEGLAFPQEGWVLAESRNNERMNWCDIESAMSLSLTKKAEAGTPRPKLINGCFVPLWNVVKWAIETLKKSTAGVSGLSLQETVLILFMRKNETYWSQDSFYPHLLDQLKTFEKAFGTFIEKEIDKGNKPFEASKLVSQIIDQEYQVSSQNPRGLLNSIDSFNYSDPFSNNSGVFRINGDVSHPIFGIDSEEVKPNREEYLFTKTYRKLEQNESTIAKIPLTNFEALYVYGHSLNKQDYSYFFPLFDYMGLADISRSTKVVFAYSNHEIKGMSQDQANAFILSQLCRNVAGLFEAYENYRNKTEDHRLLDTLAFQRRLTLKLIG